MPKLILPFGVILKQQNKTQQCYLVFYINYNNYHTLPSSKLHNEFISILNNARDFSLDLTFIFCATPYTVHVSRS